MWPGLGRDWYSLRMLACHLTMLFVRTALCVCVCGGGRRTFTGRALMPLWGMFTRALDGRAGSL